MEQRHQMRSRIAGMLAVVALVGGACTSSTKASSGTSASTTSAATATTSGVARTASAPGVTPDQITVGTIADVTGPVPGLFQGAIYGTEAYAAYINSEGGVNGRKLVVKTADSGLTCAQTQTATQSLVTSVFALVGGLADFDNCEVPVLKANPIVSMIGYPLSDEMKALDQAWNPQPAPRGQWTGPHIDFKNKYPAAVTKVGALYNSIPSAIDNYNQTKAMMQSLGYKFIYERAVSPTETDFTADILRMKNLGVQYFNFTNLNIQDVARVLNAAQQQNWHPQVLDANTAYDANLLKLVNPGAAENVTSEQYWLMFLGQDREANAEVNTYLTWLDKTKPGFPPDFFTFYSWVSMALFVQALKAAGPNPNQEDLVTAIRAMHSFNDNEFIATADPGDRKPATCWSRLILKNGQWAHDTPPTATYQCAPSGYFYYHK